jgi:hypothetical protein|nr:MAG TPA: hypothetical protein [Caudoviricetes sp.]
MATNGILEGIQGASALLNMYHGIRDRQDRREAEARDFAHKEARERLADTQWQMNYDRQGDQFNQQMDLRRQEHADNMAYRREALAEQRRSHNMSHGLSAARFRREEERYRQERADAEAARKATEDFYRQRVLGVDGKDSNISYGEAAAIPGVIKESLGETGNMLLAAAGFKLPEGTPGNAVVGAMDDKKGGIIPVAISKDAEGRGRVEAISGPVPREQVSEFVANGGSQLAGTAFAAALGVQAAQDTNKVRDAQDARDNREYNLARIDQAISIVQNPKISKEIREEAAQELEAYRVAGVDTKLRGRSLVEGVARMQEEQKTVRKAELDALGTVTKTEAEARLDRQRDTATNKEFATLRKDLITSAGDLYDKKDPRSRVAAGLVDAGLTYIEDTQGRRAGQANSSAFKAQFNNIIRTAVNLKTDDFAAAYAATQRYGGTGNENQTDILLGSYNSARRLLEEAGMSEAEANRALTQATDALLKHDKQTNFSELPRYITEKYGIKGN